MINPENILPDYTAEILTKGGKAAAIGEIRTFGGKKYKKTTNGWRPVSKKDSKVEDSKETAGSDKSKTKSSLKEELDHHYSELDNLEEKKKNYIAQHGEEKYNERHKKIEDQIERTRKELDSLKDSEIKSDKKIKTNDSSSSETIGRTNTSEIKSMMSWMKGKNSSNWTLKDRDKAVAFLKKVPVGLRSKDRNLINAMNMTLKNVHLLTLYKKNKQID